MKIFKKQYIDSDIILTYNSIVLNLKNKENKEAI